MHPAIPSRAFRGMLLFLSAAGLSAAAQTAPPAAIPTPSQVQGGPKSSAQPAGPEADGQVVQLSPFEVSSTEAKGYTALNSNSITQFKTELGRLPVSADIFDQQFMDDVGATSVEDMIDTYSAGAGIANANPGSSASNSQPLDRNGNSFLSLRGVTAPTMLRDGIMPLNTFFNSGSTFTNYTSNFDTESVEVVNGPQALLYGVGGAGGVINLVSKRAHIGRPTFGSYRFQVDQYGHKLNELDYGTSAGRVAVRFDLIDQQLGNRRLYVGGPLKGAYGQIAIRLGNTTVRLTGEQTDAQKYNSAGMSLTALSNSNDARNSQSIRYLLYTNQILAAAGGGASGAGVIGNGQVNWNNIDSYGGWWNGEFARDTFETVTADTTWNSWLTTEAEAGYRAEIDRVAGSGPRLVAPNVAANPTGTWAAENTNAGMLYEPLRVKVVRFAAVASNTLFNGKAHSETVAGVDYSRSDGDVITYRYELADSSFNPVVSANTSSNNGYTNLPNVYWPVANGPVKEPYWAPLSPHVSYGGNNYVLMIPNDTVASMISPGNPLGLSGHGSGDHRIGKAINSGVYLANYTDWLDNRLSTLLGGRLGRTDELNQLEQSPPYTPSGDLAARAHTTSFNAGVNYGVTDWLRPYVTASNSYDAPAVLSADPEGHAPRVAHAVGEEAGIKIANLQGVVSGSIAYFHADSKNEQYSFTSTLTNDINPSGLNGRYGAVSNFVNLDRTTSGVQVIITATPTPAWNMRFNFATVTGKIHSSARYPQFYNDQFHENAQGQVTYADGAVVYVMPNASKATIAAATTPGAAPFTVAMMNDASSTYYANPSPISAAISHSSGAATILNMVDPTHGAILTGVTGLPISALQIAPLASAPPPGSILLAQPGDFATQYPRLSANYTSTYTFQNGLLKGLELGGTVSAYWKYADYYYYPSGTGQPNAPRILFYQPVECTFNGIFGYARRFDRFKLRFQLNVYNMFNHYHAYLMPNAVTGYAGPDSVTFDQQPRDFVFTTTLSF